jgi:nucleoside-diphosphate-sugar epimerase
VKILVSGAGGFLGQHLIPALLSRNHSVRAIFRDKANKPPAWIDRVESYYADLAADRLQHAFDGIDVVIHLAGTARCQTSATLSSVSPTQNFLRAMARSPAKRLIHLSSLAVYDWSLAKVTLDEDTPIITSFGDVSDYAISKVLQERQVLEYTKANGWDTIILRPGFIWGPDRADIAGMGRRLGRFYLLIGPFTELPLVHVDNCVDLIVKVTELEAIESATFNVIDDTKVKVWRYVYEYIKRTRRYGFALPVPYRLGALIAVFVSKAVRGIMRVRTLPSLLTPRQFEAQFKPLKFSRERTRTVLNWQPPFDFNSCLDLTYRRTP